MAFIPTAGAVRTDMQFLLNNQQVHNIFWFSREANWTEAEREALNDALKTWWDTTGKTYFSGQLVLTQITTVNQETASAPSSTLIVSPGIAGTVSGATVPTHTACCATLRTDLRGRSYRGRTYLGGVPSGGLADNLTFTTTFVANVITALTALKTAIEALGAVWVVVSKYTNKIPRAAGTKTPITAIAVDTYIDSQRRRLGGRGV
ncbi:MAG TPA: hypothetical protein V6C97_27305 [Oculatellaceae cyanobacterium]